MAKKKAIGIDLGTSKCCVGVVRDGKVEILENERGNKTTPSYVAFTDTERLVGEDAKDQATLNPVNTVFGVKQIIGREWKDVSLKGAVDKMPYTIMNKNEERVCINLSYKKVEESLLPQQITAMLLGKMKDLAEHHLKCEVEEAVISVPASFSNAQRQATKDAAAIAGLKVLALINEPTAAAIAYHANRRKTDEENVAVVDFGAAKLDVAIVTVCKGRVSVRAVSGSTAIGGDDIDMVLIEYVSRKFEDKYNQKLPVSSAMTERLRSCSEKLKRKLTLLPKVQETLDCFGDDNVLPVSINRGDLKAIMPELVQSSLRKCLHRALQASGISLKNVSRVILVGGSSRIPLFQVWLEDLFGPNLLDKSVNPDEAVAYGATLYAALLCGDNELEELAVRDCVPNNYCYTSNGDSNLQHVFEQHSSIPSPRRRVFVFNSQSPFNEKTRAHTFELYEELTGQKNPHQLIGTLCLEDEFRQAVSLISDVAFEIDRCGIFNAVVQLRPHHVFADVVKNYAGKLSKDKLKIAVEREQQFSRDDLEEKKRVEAMSSLEALSFRLQSLLVDGDTKAKELFPELVNQIGDKAKENIQWLDATNNVPKTECMKKEKTLQELYNTLKLQLQKHQKKECERVAVVNDLKNYLVKLDTFTSGPDVSEDREEAAEIESQVVQTKLWLQSTETPSKHECTEKGRILEKLYNILEKKLEERRKETERITAVSTLRIYCCNVEKTLTSDSNGEDYRDLTDRVLHQVLANLRWLDNANDISAAECEAKKSSLDELHAEMKQKVSTRKTEKETEKRATAARRLKAYCNSLIHSVVRCRKNKEFDPDLVSHLENEVKDTLRWLGDGRTASKETCDKKFCDLETLEATLKDSVEKRQRNETNRIAAQQKFETYVAGVKISCPVLKKEPNKDDMLVWNIAELMKVISLWIRTPHTFSNADFEVKFQTLEGLVGTLKKASEKANKKTLNDKANEQLDAFKPNKAFNLRLQQSHAISSSGGNAGHKSSANGTVQASWQVGEKDPHKDREDAKRDEDEAGIKNKSWFRKTFLE